MTMIGTAAVALTVAVASYLFAQLRSRRIRERYVWLWLILLIAIVVVALVPGLMEWLSDITGFHYPSNMILTAAATVTFLITVSLSIEVSRLQMSVRTLAEEVAYLRLEVTESLSGGASTDADEPGPSEPDSSGTHPGQ